jgi:MFS family permease
MSAGARVIAMLVAMTALSQFYRASQSVIAPELTRELALSPRLLGMANGSFFLAIGLAQVPIGSLFDRYGPRRVITLLTAVAVLGAAVHALAQDGATLVWARLLLGLGCAGSFMGAVVLCGRWYGGPRFATVLSWVFAASNVGVLAATAPLAAATRAVGWRWGFAALAVLTAVLAILFYALVRDAPPGPARAPAGERLRDTLRGVLEVWRVPGLGPVLAMHTFAYASVITVLGLWAGPYLHDVHGLDSAARGTILLAMAVAQIAGVLGYGPLDRWFRSRKRIVSTGALGTIAVLVALAALARPPVWLASSLLVLLCLVTAYGILIVAHGRSLFPDHLVGRGVTTVNLAQVAGTTLLPVLTGAIVGAFPTTVNGSPEIAYRLAFAAIAGCLAAGLDLYQRARDPVDLSPR